MNTKNWKEFRVGDLFNHIGKTAIIDPASKRKCKDEIYNIPALSSTVINNSFGYYANPKEHNIIDKRCLSVTSNGDAGKVYFQNQPFVIAQDAYVLYLKDDDRENVYLFIASILEKFLMSRYNYDNKATWSKVKNEIIELPAKDDKPDFDYMEDFIKNRENIVKEKIENFKNIKERKFKIDTQEWKKFELKKLFKIEQSKGDIQYKKAKRGNIPLISSGNGDNNGIVGYITSGDGIAEIFKKGTLTIDMFGVSNYQNKDYFAVSHGRVTILNPKYDMSEDGLKFISICLTKKFSTLCSYNQMCSMTLLKKEFILLPVKNNEPDWDYMENYINKKQKEVKEKLELLRR